MRRLRWIAVLAAALVCAGGSQSPAQGQAAQPPAPGSGAHSPELTGLARISFRVSDLDREVDFFGKLGFVEAFSNVENGRTLQVFIKVNDEQFIVVYPQVDPPQALGFMHACYQTMDVKALRAHYLAEGLQPTPLTTDATGNPQFSLLDPDSRVTEFTQYMPDSRQANDRGQHLGDRRVSDQLLGFELPVTDIKAARKFYEELGFDAEPDGANIRLSLPADPDLRIELHSERVNDQPQFLFPVDDARRAASELHSAGLKVQRNDKLVFLRDPDGNAFVLLETGGHSPRHLLPWRK